MNLDNDTDSDGNNIVPCPICLNTYCPSKEGGECPEEEEFVTSFSKNEPLNQIFSQKSVANQVLESETKSEQKKWQKHNMNQLLDNLDKSITPIFQTNNMPSELIKDLNAVLEKHGWKYRLGNFVRKNKGSDWHGVIRGIYFTEQTKEGYAVESGAHKNTVQIYPEQALEKDI